MNYVIGKETLMIRLEGSITSKNAHLIEDELIDLLENNKDLVPVIDADKLEYISSAGLRVLLRARGIRGKNIEIVNASDEIVEIFNITRFTDMFDISKPLRSIYLRHSVVVFHGMNGEIYNLDDDSMVKVFKKGTLLNTVKKEREYAHTALLCGIPTLIPYDVVSVGGSYGVVYESAGYMTLASAMKNNPDKLDDLAVRFAGFLHDLHNIKIKDEFPDIKEKYRQWLKQAGVSFSDGDRKNMDILIGGIPDSNGYIHGYITPGNVIVNGDEFMLMDMAGSAHGHPFFDLQGLYSSLVEIEKENPMYCSSTFGVSGKSCSEFWDTFFATYMSGRSETELAKMEALLLSQHELKKKLLSKVKVN